MLNQEGILNSLSCGEIEPLGRITWGSNFTILVKINTSPPAQQEIFGIYKPVKGERPLWDFPSGLAKRERCAYLVSEQLGWNLIPPTVLREGPAGEGSLQFFINAEKDFFDLVPDEKPLYSEQLEKLCALDVVMNSTDRKSGHILIDEDGKIWGIDNALSFHSDFKLRTVLWDFAGEKIPSSIIQDLKDFLDAGPDGELNEHLSPAEIEAVIQRAGWVTQNACFPRDEGRYSYPYPL